MLVHWRSYLSFGDNYQNKSEDTLLTDVNLQGLVDQVHPRRLKEITDPKDSMGHSTKP